MEAGNPEKALRRLWDAGYDATRGKGGMAVLEGRGKAPRAGRLLESLVYLPTHKALRRGGAQALAAKAREALK